MVGKTKLTAVLNLTDSEKYPAEAQLCFFVKFGNRLYMKNSRTVCLIGTVKEMDRNPIFIPFQMTILFVAR